MAVINNLITVWTNVVNVTGVIVRVDSIDTSSIPTVHILAIIYLLLAKLSTVVFVAHTGAILKAVPIVIATVKFTGVLSYGAELPIVPHLTL